MVADLKTVDPDSVGVLIDWFYNRYGLSRNPDRDPHEVWAHLLFGFSPTYQGEKLAAVADMVLRCNPEYGSSSVSLRQRRSLETVQEKLKGYDCLLHKY
jgi:hypothetical protein